jgi:hypothetical protein
MNDVGAESALQDRPTKHQVEARAAGERVMAFAQRVDAMEVQPREAAPTRLRRRARAGPGAAGVRAARRPTGTSPAPPRTPTRSVRQVLFIAVLMECQARAELGTVDEARVRCEAVEPRRAWGAHRETREHFGHPRPEATSLRIDSVVAIAAAVAQPARLAAVRHRDRHAQTARRRHVSKRSLLRHVVNRVEQRRRFLGRKSAQKERAGCEVRPSIGVDTGPSTTWLAGTRSLTAVPWPTHDLMSMT